MKPTRQYWNAIQVSLVFQIFLGLFGILALDFGEICYIWLITMVAYWAEVILMMIRRPVSPTRLDLFLVRWSYPALFLIAIPIVAAIWKARGFLELK